MLRVELWVHRNASLDHGAASASGSLGFQACQGKLEGTPKLEDCGGYRTLLANIW